jgi:molybdenum cofactor synthesis domain-containing protein
MHGAGEALVITVSDGVAAGVRADESGERLATRLGQLGFAVRQELVRDDEAAIREAIGNANGSLVLITGGTGLGPRDVTPQAVLALASYEVPGFGERMRAYGRERTPMADLSRSLACVVGHTLVIAVPGSPGGALDSLEALVPILDHALDTLAGHTEHVPAGQPPAPAA